MKKIKIVFIAIIGVFITVIGALTVFNHREESELEGRELQTFVKPDVSSVMDGSFAQKTDSAFSDQLEARDFFVQAYYKLTFQTYNGDVAKGSENQLFSSQQEEPDYIKKEKELKSIAKQINNTADELALDGRKFIYVSIPRKDAVMTGYLPESYTSSDEIYKWSINVLKENFNENVIVIDGYELFSQAYKNGENCYFTTDHHVNFTGGMLVYNEIAEIIKADYPNTNILTRDDYNVEKVVVNGSFNRLIGQSVKAESEELNISLKELNFQYTRKENGKISDKQIWGSGTTYASAYMDDDNEETVIKTTNKNYPNILITGSSYSNLLEVLLIPNANTMASVDYRYNKTGKSLLEYADETDAQYVIYIPAQSTNAHNTNSMKTHLGIIKSEAQ